MAQKRLLSLCMALVLLFDAVLCRVFWISTDTSYAASAGAQTVSDTVLPRRRGDFFDRSGRPLTGTQERWVALCIPGDGSYANLFPHVSYAAQDELYAMRNAAAPFLIDLEEDLSRYGVTCYKTSERWLPLPIARHLLGYLDGDGHGVAGLERVYDDVLAAANAQNAVTCVTTAQGSLMTGSEPQLATLQQGSGQGVRLTLDADIQRLCEGVGAGMARGCILVLDTATAEVLASVSMPEFDPSDIAASITADDTSLIDRPLAAFSAGSVFKMVLAVAAYEAGLDWYTHDCTGSIEVAGQTYRCAKGHAHGPVNLRGALEVSCNTYFIELGQALGAERLAETARRLGFGTALTVAPGLKSADGAVPTADELQNAGQLAMFSFGQGSLTVTPLQVAAMMNTLADGGILRAPRFVQGIVDAETQEIVSAPETPQPRRVCSADIARVLRSMLCTVVEDGIGKDALPVAGGAGGKTGTAQTGQYDENGEELLNHWFAGFWPAEDPRYTVVVLQDGLLEPETSSAALFAQVANGLLAMQPDFAELTGPEPPEEEEGTAETA